MTLRVGEAASLSLLDHRPAPASAFLRVARPGAASRGRARLLAALLEPAEAWEMAADAAAELGAAAQAAIEAASVGQAIAASLLTVADDLNQLALGIARATARRVALGMTLAMLRDDDLCVAMLPPGQLYVCQAGDVHAFPPPGGAPADSAASLADCRPLGVGQRVAPRLLRTRVADGDLVLVVSSTIAARAPRLDAALRAARTADDALTAVGLACERGQAAHAAAGAVRIARG